MPLTCGNADAGIQAIQQPDTKGLAELDLPWVLPLHRALGILVQGALHHVLVRRMAHHGLPLGRWLFRRQRGNKAQVSVLFGHVSSTSHLGSGFPANVLLYPLYHSHRPPLAGATMTTGTALVRVLAERERQAELWSAPHEWGVGDCSSPSIAPEVKLMVLMEEVGEVARATYEKDIDALRTEITQVAAVAVAWLESLEEK